MTNHASAKAQHTTPRKLNVTNVALVVLAIVVAIMLVLDLLLLKPVNSPAGVTTGATPAMPMSAPTSDY